MAAKLNWGAVGAAIRSAEATGTTVGIPGIALTGERFGYNAGRRFIRPDYRLSARPSPDTPDILMLS